MRGQSKDGFRFTENRIAKGLLTRTLAEAHVRIEKALKSGQKLPLDLQKAHKLIQRNARIAHKKGLLSKEVSEKHPVDKSAIRRDALDRYRKTG
jgi:hypothetical protein